MDKAIANFITRQKVARIGTITPEGEPHVLPICFSLDGKRIYSVVDEKPKSVPPFRLKRLRNILSNPSVTVLFDQYFEDWSRLGYVAVHGYAEIVQEGVMHSRALRLLRRKYRQYRRMKLEDKPIIVVIPQKVSSWGNLKP